MNSSKSRHEAKQVRGLRGLLCAEGYKRELLERGTSSRDSGRRFIRLAPPRRGGRTLRRSFLTDSHADFLETKLKIRIFTKLARTVAGPPRRAGSCGRTPPSVSTLAKSRLRFLTDSHGNTLSRRTHSCGNKAPWFG